MQPKERAAETWHANWYNFYPLVERPNRWVFNLSDTTVSSHEFTQTFILVSKFSYLYSKFDSAHHHWPSLFFFKNVCSTIAITCPIVSRILWVSVYNNCSSRRWMVVRLLPPIWWRWNRLFVETWPSSWQLDCKGVLELYQWRGRCCCIVAGKS